MWSPLWFICIQGLFLGHSVNFSLFPKLFAIWLWTRNKWMYSLGIPSLLIYELSLWEKGARVFHTLNLFLQSHLFSYHFCIPVMFHALFETEPKSLLFSGISKSVFLLEARKGKQSHIFPLTRKLHRGLSANTHTLIMKRCIDEDSSSCGCQLKYIEVPS